MKFAALLMMGVSLGLACPAVAQTGREGVQSFQQGGDSWLPCRRKTISRRLSVRA